VSRQRDKAVPVRIRPAVPTRCRRPSEGLHQRVDGSAHPFRLTAPRVMEGPERGETTVSTTTVRDLAPSVLGRVTPVGTQPRSRDRVIGGRDAVLPAMGGTVPSAVPAFLVSGMVKREREDRGQGDEGTGG
jgi:hypothetical protein